MALDPQAQAVIDLAAKAGRPPYHRLSPKDARQQYRDTRAPLQPRPPELAAIKDLSAGAPHASIPVRLYRPVTERGDSLLPGLVYFHGGGWVIGDLETHDVLCRQLADRSGMAVVSVDYRLAPEHKFPAAVDDCWTATQWVATSAAGLGIDARRLAVGGDSAGGNLATVIAILARDAGGPALAFQLLIYPATDLAGNTASHAAFADGYLLTRDSIRWFTEHYLQTNADANDWRASPNRARSLRGLPPALVITAGFDPLRDEGEAYASRLREADVTVDYICYGGMIHGFFPMGGVLDTANRALSHASASLRQALG
jgi:acetyl esterase/lipase